MFGSRAPTVGVQGGVVTVRYPGSPTDEWLNYRSERAAEVVLNPSFPWNIEVRGSASGFLADLRELRLGFQAPGDMRRKRLGPTRNEQVGVSNRLVGSLFLLKLENHIKQSSEDCLLWQLTTVVTTTQFGQR
jgi:hypothetical protein